MNAASTAKPTGRSLPEMQQSESLAVRPDSVCAVAARVSRSSLRIPPSFDERSLRIQGIDRECGVDAVPVRVDLSGDFDPGRAVLPHRDDLVGRGQQPSRTRVLPNCPGTTWKPAKAARTRARESREAGRPLRRQNGTGSTLNPCASSGETHAASRRSRLQVAEGSRWSWRLERHACQTGHLLGPAPGVKKRPA